MIRLRQCWGGGLKTATTHIMGEAVKSKGNVVYDFLVLRGNESISKAIVGDLRGKLYDEKIKEL